MVIKCNWSRFAELKLSEESGMDRNDGRGNKKDMRVASPCWLLQHRRYPISHWGGADDLMLVMSWSIESRRGAVEWSSVSGIHSCCVIFVKRTVSPDRVYVCVGVCVVKWGLWAEISDCATEELSPDASPMNLCSSSSADQVSWLLSSLSEYRLCNGPAWL